MKSTHQPLALITGGDGFIGSHTCKFLSQQGWQLVVVDSCPDVRARTGRWAERIPMDILDATALKDLLARLQPDIVIHLAGLISIEESVRNPQRFLDVNVQGTVNLLEAMVKSSCRRLVFSSSCAVYGTPEIIPIDESCSLNPANPYGRSKLQAEALIRNYGEQWGIQSVCLRYFNAAGADPEGELGEEHEPETHLIPLVIEAARTNSTVTIFGDDYSTSDGTCIRDFVHVWDLALAHERAARYLLSGGNSLVCNVGGEKGVSVRDVIRAVERESGRQLSTDVQPRRAGDVPCLVATSTLARSKLGWVPQWSELPTIIHHAWKWAAR